MRGAVNVVPAGHPAAFTKTGGCVAAPANGYRTADPTFISAAAMFGHRVLAAVLTGRLDERRSRRPAHQGRRWAGARGGPLDRHGARDAERGDSHWLR